MKDRAQLAFDLISDTLAKTTTGIGLGLALAGSLLLAPARAGLAVEFVHYEQAGKLADGGKAGAWDIAFLANEPVRAAEIEFSPAYLEIETSYLVPVGASSARTAGESVVMVARC